MDLLNTDAKNKALKELEKAQLEYKLIGERANKDVVSLYNIRKEALQCIEEAELFLKNKPDFGIENIAKIAEYRASIRLFAEAVQNEVKVSRQSKHHAGQFVQCAMACPADTVFDQTAAMAFATTFGTAATGAAITTLSSAAATNAAFAWLGGGALVAGSGGAAVRAFLAMAGPIGLAIGTVTAGFAGFKIASKNKEIADKAKSMSSEIYNATKKMDNAIHAVNEIHYKILDCIHKLRYGLRKVNSMTIYDFSEIVSVISKLCSLINVKISV